MPITGRLYMYAAYMCENTVQAWNYRCALQQCWLLRQVNERQDYWYRRYWWVSADTWYWYRSNPTYNISLTSVNSIIMYYLRLQYMLVSCRCLLPGSHLIVPMLSVF